MSLFDSVQQAIKIRTSTDSALRVDFDAKPKFQRASLFATHEHTTSPGARSTAHSTTGSPHHFEACPCPLCRFDTHGKEGLNKKGSAVDKDSVRVARDLPLEQRLAECSAMKAQGNELLRSGHTEQACNTYEQALAVFWYLDNRNSKWKTSGIKDEDIFEVHFMPPRAADRKRVRSMEVALLLNVARACLAQRDYVTSKEACTAALSIDPACAAALFLRGKGLVAPASAGSSETEEAIRDLSQAAKLAPSDPAVRALLNKLQAERIHQKRADHATFAGMFDRGTVYEGSSAKIMTEKDHAPLSGDEIAHARGWRSKGQGISNKNNVVTVSDRAQRAHDGADTRRDVEQQLAMMERLATQCVDEERFDEAKNFRTRIAAIRKALDEHDKKRRNADGWNALRIDDSAPDWRNTTEDMRKKAEEGGLDLENPAVLRFLRRAHDERYRKVHGKKIRRGRVPATSAKLGCAHFHSDGEHEHGASSGSEGHTDDWSAETCEGALRCMDRSGLCSLLRASAVEVDLDMTLGQLRDFAVSKLLPKPGTRGSDHGHVVRRGGSKKKMNRKRSDWKLSAAITLVVLVFKSYQMGFMSWMLKGERPKAHSKLVPGHRTHARGGSEGASNFMPHAMGFTSENRANFDVPPVTVAVGNGDLRHATTSLDDPADHQYSARVLAFDATNEGSRDRDRSKGAKTALVDIPDSAVHYSETHDSTCESRGYFDATTENVRSDCLPDGTLFLGDMPRHQCSALDHAIDASDMRDGDDDRSDGAKRVHGVHPLDASNFSDARDFASDDRGHIDPSPTGVTVGMDGFPHGTELLDDAGNYQCSARESAIDAISASDGGDDESEGAKKAVVDVRPDALTYARARVSPPEDREDLDYSPTFDAVGIDEPHGLNFLEELLCHQCSARDFAADASGVSGGGDNERDGTEQVLAEMPSQASKYRNLHDGTLGARSNVDSLPAGVAIGIDDVVDGMLSDGDVACHQSSGPEVAGDTCGTSDGHEDGSAGGKETHIEKQHDVSEYHETHYCYPGGRSDFDFPAATVTVGIDDLPDGKRFPDDRESHRCSARGYAMKENDVNGGDDEGIEGQRHPPVNT